LEHQHRTIKLLFFLRKKEIMFRDREEIRRRLHGIIEQFRQKGATSPEKALTLQELGLPPRFEQAMHRRLGQTGIFVEINGRYYLNEERLKQIQEQRAKGGLGGEGAGLERGGAPTWMRAAGIFLILPIGLIVAVVLFYLVGYLGGGYYPGEFFIVLLVIPLGLTVARLLFRRSRRRYWREQVGERNGKYDFLVGFTKAVSMFRPFWLTPVFRKKTFLSCLF
jgi:hypothetical protein